MNYLYWTLKEHKAYVKKSGLSPRTWDCVHAWYGYHPRWGTRPSRQEIAASVKCGSFDDYGKKVRAELVAWLKKRRKSL